MFTPTDPTLAEVVTFWFGWVGAVPHPLPGVPLTFLSDISYGDPWKIIMIFCNANANAYPDANANAKVLLNLFLQKAFNHHPPFSFWLGGWVLCLILCQGST